MKVASDFGRPACSSCYEVAGRFLLLEISDRATRTAVQSFLKRWHLKPVSRLEGRSPDATIVFELGGLEDVSPEFEKFALIGGATGYASDTTYEIRFNEATVYADESPIVRVRLSRPLVPESELLPQLVSNSLSVALRRCSVFELHSGAVTDKKSGKSILICGPSGSGKSTLSLQLVAMGWSYLSDDVLLLSTVGHNVKATGLRRFFALTPETMARSGLERVSKMLPDQPPLSAKMRVLPEDIFPDSSVDECQPNVLFFPMLTGSATSLTRELTSTETMARLIRLCPWSCYDRAVARLFLDCLSKLVKQSESYDLLAGRDLMGEPAYTEKFLRSVLKNPGK